MPTKREKIQQFQQTIFTGRNSELDFFESCLPLERETSVDILVVYGIGGIGKSELLNEFQRILQNVHIPFAFLDVHLNGTVFDFLLSIHRQLKNRLRFSKFEEGLKRHQDIENRLLGHAGISKTVIQMFAKGVHTTLKLIPGANLVTDVISPEHIETAVSGIYSAVGRKEGDFWMHPEEELTEQLVLDLNNYCEYDRLILMIDTYEKVGALDSWVRDKLFDNLGEYGFVIIASRSPLEGKEWHKYNNLIRQIELKPFSEEEARKYLGEKGIIEAQLVTLLTDYSEGHPLTLSLLAQLSKQGGAKDLKLSPERQKIIHTLIERITQNVTDDLRNALEMCAILRIVNEDVLSFMLDVNDIRKTFEVIRRFDFVKVHDEGIALHDVVWAAMNEEIQWRSPVHYQRLNAKASEFYAQGLAESIAKAKEGWQKDLIYHSIQANEINGMALFCNRSEELIRYLLIDQFKMLLTDLNSYELKLLDSIAWRKYYNARLSQLERYFLQAEVVYSEISQDTQINNRVRAYALCDMIQVVTRKERLSGLEYANRVIMLLEEIGRIMPPKEPKMAFAYTYAVGAFTSIGNFVGAIETLQQALKLFQEVEDLYGIVYTLSEMRSVNGLMGNWHMARQLQTQGLKIIDQIPESQILKAFLMGNANWIFIWSGYYTLAEQGARNALVFFRKVNDLQSVASRLRLLGIVLGAQRKFEESRQYLMEGLDLTIRITGGSDMAHGGGMAQGFLGLTFAKQGEFKEAEQRLLKALEIKKHFKDNIGIPEIYVWLGELYEAEAKYAKIEEQPLKLEYATSCYKICLRDYTWTNRHYFVCSAIVGLIRLMQVQGILEGIEELIVKAEALAEQYEYNDHLASLRLTQGYLIWQQEGSQSVLENRKSFSYFQQSLVYALRFNRFLLDELLGEQPGGIPFRPIIPFCLQQGEAGQQLLVGLREWWLVGQNSLEPERADTISAVPLNISLIEVEGIAREQELGNGDRQVTVIQQLEVALQIAKN